MTTLEALIAQTAADWQIRVAVVCEHTQVISYGQLAEILAPKVRERIAAEIEAELVADGDGSSWDGGMSNAVSIARGEHPTTASAILRPDDLAEILDYVAGRGDVRVVQEETLSRAFDALKATVRSKT